MTEPTTAAGRALLAGFSGIAGYRPRSSHEVVGIRDAILAIEVEARQQDASALPSEALSEVLACTVRGVYSRGDGETYECMTCDAEARGALFHDPDCDAEAVRRWLAALREPKR